MYIRDQNFSFPSSDSKEGGCGMIWVIMAFFLALMLSSFIYSSSHLR